MPGNACALIPALRNEGTPSLRRILRMLKYAETPIPQVSGLNHKKGERPDRRVGM